VDHVRHEYASLLSMCDAKMGDILDLMDELDMWKDTMLVVWTDHGFMLGEHDCWAKCWQPFYEEIAHTPFFVWDPRCGRAGERRSALVQPSIDLAPTLLRAFGVDPTPDMTGCDLAATIAGDTPVRDAAIFGLHGGHVNVTDGRYVYMRGPATADNRPLANYTLMPTHMHRTFGPDELRDNIALAEPFPFTKGCRTMRIDTRGVRLAGRATQDARENMPTRLYDLESDPAQQTPLQDPSVEKRMTGLLVRLMKACHAPAEQFQRLGLA
jgi:arylsulfatase A-like enzyme